MSDRQRRVFWPILLVILAVSSAVVLLAAKTRVRSGSKERSLFVTSKSANPNQTIPAQVPNRPALRNLSLQPEAFKLGRRLGQRFMSSRREVSVMTGNLTTGTDRQLVNIVRRQTERGERVEIAFGVAPASLSWSETEGPKTASGAPNEVERALIERLAFDSVDQFVLAQLRGASYYTVARNVRPGEAGASDSYTGPVWDVVRVDDPEQDAQKKPLSKWQLYYINSQTGLIDKIVTEIQGQKIEASFSDWTNQGGERVPTQIVWTRQGQAIMSFTLTSFTHAAAQ